MSPDERAPVPPRQRLILLGALWAALAVVFIVFRGVLLPFAAAALIAYLVAPFVGRITRLRIGRRPVPRWAAILAIYTVFFALVYLATVLLVPQLYRELARISKDALDYLNSLTPERIQELARAAERWLSAHGLPVELSSRSLEGADAPAAHHATWSLTLDLQQLINELAAKATAFVKGSLGDLVTLTRAVVGGVLSFVFMLFFVLMLGAYTSVDARAIRGWARTLVPPEHADDVKLLVEGIDRSLAGVVRGQVTICLINGILTFIGLLLFGVKFAFLLATVATVFSLIPIFGSIISSVPIVAIALSQNWRTALSVLAWIIGIHALEAYLLNPKIMGSAARIHPIVVAFALIAGERTFGLVGALFAVPVAAIFVGVFEFARLKAQPQPTVAALAPPPAAAPPAG